MVGRFPLLFFFSSSRDFRPDADRPEPLFDILVWAMTCARVCGQVKHGVMFDRREAEGTKRRHQVDTVVEGMSVIDTPYFSRLPLTALDTEGSTGSSRISNSLSPSSTMRSGELNLHTSICSLESRTHPFSLSTPPKPRSIPDEAHDRRRRNIEELSCGRVNAERWIPSSPHLFLD